MKTQENTKNGKMESCRCCLLEDVLIGEELHPLVLLVNGNAGSI